jgi:NitT/TauT family transport system permease protein
MTSSIETPSIDTPTPTLTRRRFAKLRGKRFWWTVFWRLVILATMVLAWEFLPKIEFLSTRFKWLNPFFVSSPTRVWNQLQAMATGENNVPYVWPYLLRTTEGVLVGTALGIIVGTILGAFLSNNERLSEIFAIYVTVFNAVPRIALIPVIVIIFGTGVKSSIVTAILVVSFLAFFNAFEGGRSVPRPVLQNAQVLKASPRQIMFRVRFPYVMMWVFAAIPNAISFGLISVVTAELLTGTRGMGGLLLQAVETVNSSLTFSIVVIMSILGVIFVTIAERIKRAVLHWAA